MRDGFFTFIRWFIVRPIKMGTVIFMSIILSIREISRRFADTIYTVQFIIWLATYGVFRVCPVPGYTDINDNYGITVRIPDVPVHRHTGVDVAAPTGSPIVAPFDGYVSTTRSELGGLEVRIAGEAGYVYNAHAAAAAAYGWVDAGTVIGYVGATGDATAPHVHLEWHPGDGLAVDPYVYVVAACVRAP
jgi:murein DD-endopeptidase MepM/ murein hydrolase activator NlpD